MLPVQLYRFLYILHQVLLPVFVPAELLLLFEASGLNLLPFPAGEAVPGQQQAPGSGKTVLSA